VVERDRVNALFRRYETRKKKKTEKRKRGYTMAGLDYDLLRSSVQSLADNIGWGGRSEIEKTAKVSNLGRFLNHEIKPTLDTWQKLHQRYPDSIPEPTWVKDGTTVLTISGDHNSQDGNTVSIGVKTVDITDELAELIKKYHSPAENERLLAKLRKRRDQIKHGDIYD
jgi:hypothetical protein